MRCHIENPTTTTSAVLWKTLRVTLVRKDENISSTNSDIKAVVNLSPTISANSPEFATRSKERLCNCSFGCSGNNKPGIYLRLSRSPKKSPKIRHHPQPPNKLLMFSNANNAASTTPIRTAVCGHYLVSRNITHHAHASLTHSQPGKGRSAFMTWPRRRLTDPASPSTLGATQQFSELYQ